MAEAKMAWLSIGFYFDRCFELKIETLLRYNYFVSCLVLIYLFIYFVNTKDILIDDFFIFYYYLYMMTNPVKNSNIVQGILQEQLYLVCQSHGLHEILRNGCGR